MKTAVERLIDAIGYPDRAPAGSLSFQLLVDGAKIVASEEGGRLRLVFHLSADDSHLPQLAAYAAGRMMREEAALAYGSSTVQRSGAQPFLWQDAPADADAKTLARLFETFADSCDWWRARVEESGENGQAEISEAVIRP